MMKQITRNSRRDLVMLLLLLLCGLAGCAVVDRLQGTGELPEAKRPQRLAVGTTTAVFTDPEYYASFPGFIRTKKELVIQFGTQELGALRAQPLHPHAYVVATERWAISRDDGQTWSVTADPPQLGPALHATRQSHSARAAMTDGSLLNFENGYVVRNGKNEPVERLLRIDKGGLGGEPVWQSPAAALSPLLDLYPYDLEPLADGRFLFSGYVSRAPGAKQVQVFHCSADGRQWTELNQESCADPLFSFAEPDAAAWPDGRVVQLLRAEFDNTKKDQAPDDVNGHGQQRDGYGYYLYQRESSDFGRTWSEPQRLAIWGHPPNLLKLNSGNLLLVYGHRRPPFSVKAILSHDRGKTWDMESMVTVHENPIGKYDMGYPMATQLADGRILVTFYDYSTTDTAEKMPHGIYCTTLEEQ